MDDTNIGNAVIAALLSRYPMNDPKDDTLIDTIIHDVSNWNASQFSAMRSFVANMRATT